MSKYLPATLGIAAILIVMPITSRGNVSSEQSEPDHQAD